MSNSRFNFNCVDSAKTAKNRMIAGAVVAFIGGASVTLAIIFGLRAMTDGGAFPWWAWLGCAIGAAPICWGITLSKQGFALSLASLDVYRK